jgi:hypothetical protein
MHCGNHSLAYLPESGLPAMIVAVQESLQALGYISAELGDYHGIYRNARQPAVQP